MRWPPFTLLPALASASLLFNPVADLAASDGEPVLEAGLDAFLGEPTLDIQKVFESERFPNISVTLDGTVVTTFGNQRIRARRSVDGGESWEEVITIAESGFQGGGLTVDERTGDLLTFVEEKHPPAPVTVYRSSDEGKSWQVMPVIIEPDAEGRAPSMHMNERGITLRRGKHAGRLIRPSRHYGKGNRPESLFPTHFTNALYSDDRGKTWHTSEPFPEYGTGEAALVELSDGRIYYNTRRHWAPEGKSPLRRWHGWSVDGGHSWTDVSICEALPDGPQNTAYGCMGGLVRLPVVDRDILVYSNCDSAEGRRLGTVWASFDGGRSWPLKRLVHEGSFAYSALAVGRPGTPSEGKIYLHFESGGGSKVARFNLAWLLQGEATGDGELPTLGAAARAGHSPVTVFEAGTGGYKVFRIPAIVRAENGDLLAFCEARQGGDSSEIDLVLKRSSDDGRTWGGLQVVQESDDFLPLFAGQEKTPEITIGNPAPVVDRLDPEYPGRIWLPFTLENDRVFVVYSDDHGTTWSKRRDITAEVKRKDWGWYATGPCHAIQIQNGPHRGRLVIPADHRLGEDGKDHGANGAQTILSDDHGKTWRLGAIDDSYTDGLNANETSVVELSDGSLYFNTRDQNGDAPGTRGEAWSPDGGETFLSERSEWSAFRPVEGALDPPVVQCALLRVGENLVIFSGPDSDGPSGPGRSDLRLRRSADGAKSWRDGPLLHVGPAAYSDLVNLSSGSVGVLFEAGDPGQKNAYQRIAFVRVASLLDGE